MSETLRSMQGILFDYEINPTTWACLSALLTIGIYFKFRRFWSVRNLDLVGLIAFSPGLLLIYHGLLQNLPELVKFGYIWLFVMGGFFLIRMLLDPMMVRRPLLEPNLSASGLTFTGAALLVFLTANVITTKPALRLEHVLPGEKAVEYRGPGYTFFDYFARASNEVLRPEAEAPPEQTRHDLARAAAARTAAILAHLAIILGMVLVGYRHFDNIHTGVAVATLYLLLPYTSQMTGRVGHMVPAALLVWAFESYRRPLFAGILLGLGTMLMGLPWGVIWAPLFLLPLWCSFYWQRGLFRFLGGVVVALVLLILPLALSADSLHAFVTELRTTFVPPSIAQEQFVGFWQFFEPVYRIPVMAAFAALCGGLALWPAQKNLGTLLGCSAAVLLGTQFWYAREGGLYMAWYMPLLLLTVFRPNLEDRVAISAVAPFPRRKAQPAAA